MIYAPPILTLEDGTDTSVTNQRTLRNISEDRISQLQGGGILRSRGALQCAVYPFSCYCHH